MLTVNDEDLYTDAILACLDKYSTQIDEDLEFQLLNSKRDFHHEEICGWTVSPCDINRFRWNQQRKTLKTPNRDFKTVRRSSFRQDIDYKFKHYRHANSYMDQYRNDKIQRLDIWQDVKKSELCEVCCETTPVVCESKSPSTAVPPTQKIARPLPLFRGSLYGSQISKCKDVYTDNGAISNSKQPRGLQSEPWAVVGVEKRPIPPQTKSRTDFKGRQTRQHINKTKTMNSSLVTSSVFQGVRGAPRSNSAPNIGTAFSRQWKNEPRKTAESAIAEVDYSCYTEMFKNVLEYYGTKKLNPKHKPGSAGNSRVFSIKI